jgi:hypothetical protein
MKAWALIKPLAVGSESGKFGNLRNIRLTVNRPSVSGPSQPGGRNLTGLSYQQRIMAFYQRVVI